MAFSSFMLCSSCQPRNFLFFLFEIANTAVCSAWWTGQYNTRAAEQAHRNLSAVRGAAAYSAQRGSSTLPVTSTAGPPY